MVTRLAACALRQHNVVNFLLTLSLVSSFPLFLSCSELSEEQEEILRSDPCVQDLLNGIPRTFRTSGTFFTSGRVEGYAGNIFF